MKTLKLLFGGLFFLSVGYSFAQEKPDENKKNEISLEQFQKVDIDGGGNIFFHFSPTPKVVFRTKNSCENNLRAEVFRSTLNIKSSNPSNCIVDVHIYTSTIEEIRLNGGGKAVVKKGFPSLEKFTANLQGGGNLDLTSTKIDSLSADLDGGGTIKAHVVKFLRARTSGGGEIFYKGDPKVESNFSGGGAVRKF